LPLQFSEAAVLILHNDLICSANALDVTALFFPCFSSASNADDYSALCSVKNYLPTLRTSI